MKPAPFKYRRVKSLQEATEALAAAGGEAKLLAGGQSLVPMLNFRLVRPALLVDINAIEELDFITRSNGVSRIGALARHRSVETSVLVADTFPVLAHAMTHVAHLGVRNRGTIGAACRTPIRLPSCLSSRCCWTRRSRSPAQAAAGRCPRAISFSDP